MAIRKRTLDETCYSDHARNVRARLFYHLHPAPKCTPILRRQQRLRYTQSPPPRPIANENVGLEFELESPRRNGIRFDNQVIVRRIPSRFQYPEAIKKSIWTPMKKIRENAHRNSIEFAADGWDWRTALEDDDMYVAPNGERIHPVHVRRDFRQQTARSA
jgi:hypothetical protein